MNSVTAPTVAMERFSSVDILRGVALLGILVLNIQDFGDVSMAHDVPLGSSINIFTGVHPRLDFAALLLSWLFFEGKMRALFSMLFGAGVILLTSRAERRGTDASDVYARRNMWLAVIGVLHGSLVWAGDILLDYGLEGLIFLYPFRRLKGKQLVWIGSLLTFFIAPIGIMLFINSGRDYLLHHQVAQIVRSQSQEQALSPAQTKVLADWNELVKAKTPNAVAIQNEVREHRGQSYLASVGERAQSELWSNFARLRIATSLDCVPAMLLGMGLMKLGFFTLEMETSAYVWTSLLGFAISLPIYTLGILKVYSSRLYFYEIDTWLYAPYYVTREAGALAIAATVMLIIRSNRFPIFQKGLASVGRTAFSNYLFTSILCQTIFVWGPFPLFGQLEYYQLFIVVGLVWLLNLTGSTLWLRFFAYGPLEWVWRSLTYGRFQKLYLVPPFSRTLPQG